MGIFDRKQRKERDRQAAEERALHSAVDDPAAVWIAYLNGSDGAGLSQDVLEQVVGTRLDRAALARIGSSISYREDACVWWMRAAAVGDVPSMVAMATERPEGDLPGYEASMSSQVWVRYAGLLGETELWEERGNQELDAAPGRRENREGIKAARAGDTASAQAAFEDALAAGRTDALVMLSLLASADSDEARAAQYLERAAAESLTASFWLGVRADCAGETDTAKTWYEHTIKLAFPVPTEDEPQVLDTEFLFMDGKDEVLHAMAARYCLGALAWRDGDRDRARELWETFDAVDWNL